MTDNINVTVVEQPIAVTQAITESPVSVAITVTDAPIDVAIDASATTYSVAVAITETPIVVNVSTVQGVGEAPTDGQTYGRKNADWVPVTVTETDPIFSASEAALFATGDKAKLDGIEPGAQVNDPETDPIFGASPAAGIDAGDIANWNSKLSIESDPVFLASVAAAILLSDITNWNSKLSDAPSDGNTYGRKNGAWESIVASAVWGAITGTLSNQTDLQAALDAKQNALSFPLAVATVGTLADVMALTPTAGRVAYATTVSASDTRTINKFYVANGTNWREVELPLSPRASVDIGLKVDSGRNGYGTDYITDKTLHNVAIKGHPKSPVNGSIRMNIDSTPDTFEIYMRDIAWFTIIYDLTTALGDFRHTPLSEQIYVWRGDSASVGLNGQPVIQEYQASMGAYPTYRVLNGGTF